MREFLVVLIKATSKQNHGRSTDGTCVSLPIQIQLLRSHFFGFGKCLVSDIVSNDTTLIAVCGLYICSLNLRKIQMTECARFVQNLTVSYTCDHKLIQPTDV